MSWSCSPAWTERNNGDEYVSVGSQPDTRGDTDRQQQTDIVGKTDKRTWGD